MPQAAGNSVGNTTQRPCHGAAAYGVLPARDRALAPGASLFRDEGEGHIGRGKAA